jgi:hypothetical protein
MITEGLESRRPLDEFRSLGTAEYGACFGDGRCGGSSHKE